ncbi:MAG: glycosyltransferase family 2 protein [Oscillospiraceae bacterium]
MKISVVIPNLNGANWLGDSIKSIYAQNWADLELIVIDNASTDESLDIARSYVGTKGYMLFENAENTGFSAAVNKGIRASTGKYVLLFNNDAFAEKGFIESLVAAAEKDEKIFAVQSLMLRHYQRELADDAGDYVTLFGWAMKRGDGMYARRYTKAKRIFSACGGASLYRKSILDEIGCFDEEFFAYFEDVDISWRANSLGYKNMLCPDAKCYHICGATTGAVKYNDFKSVQSGRNSLLLPYKNMPFLMLLINFIPLLLGYLLKIVVFGLRGFWTPYIKGAREAFTALPKIKKPKFKIKNLLNYVFIELWLIWGIFIFIHYRICRLFKLK